MSKKELQDYLDMQVGKVQSNCEIVEANKENNGKMLHISPVRMSNKPYTPWIGDRQAKNEDRTVPRITVSDSVLGCIYGYAAMPTDISSAVRSGYYIHQIPFEHCLKPNNKLCYDASESNEHWLVRYNEETSSYRGKVVGRILILSTSFYKEVGSDENLSYTAIIQVEKVDSIKLINNQVLTKGYWEVKWRHGDDTINQKEPLLVISSTEAAFEKAKKVSYGKSLESMPLSTKW